MASNLEWRKLAGFAALALALVLIAGCSSQPPGVQASEEKGSDPPPFEYVSDKSGISPTGSWAPAEIPAGTAVTIRLRSGLSSESSRAGESFEAVLDDPIVIQGQTVVPRGVSVTGRVAAVKASGQLGDSGYLRLTLATISINGKLLAVQTSSIFAKGGPHEKHHQAMIGSGPGAPADGGKKDVEFSTERRLTFRLTQPLPVQG